MTYLETAAQFYSEVAQTPQIGLDIGVHDRFRHVLPERLQKRQGKQQIPDLVQMKNANALIGHADVSIKRKNYRLQEYLWQTCPQLLQSTHRPTS